MTQRVPVSKRKVVPRTSAVTVRGSEAQKRKNRAALQLLEKSVHDETGWQERNWPVVKKSLIENGMSYRKRQHG